MDDESKITLTAHNKREWPSSTLKSLNTFRQTQHTLCDVFLKGEDSGRTVPAHRCMLAANSDYFHAMFTSGLAESQREHKEVTIRGVDTDTIAAIVDFLYVGSCRLAYGSVNRVMDLMAASTMLQVDDLSHACSVYLERCLDSNNALELWLFAERYGITDLAEPCRGFVQTYFRLICESARFLELDCRDMATLVGLEELSLGHHGNQEDALLERLQSWVSHGERSLDQDLGLVLSKIRWSQVSPDCRTKFKEKVVDLQRNFDKSEEENADDDTTRIDKIMGAIPLSTESNERRFFCSICIIGGLQNSRAGRRSPQTTSFEVTDVDARTGEVLRTWTKSRGFHSNHMHIANPQYHYLPFRGRLYGFHFQQQRGGINSPFPKQHDEAICLSFANILNANLKVLRTGTHDTESMWWDLSDMYNYVRAVDETAGVVYLCGCGEQRDGTSSKRVFRLDVERNESTELTSFPFARSHHRALVVNGDLFVFGGIDRLLTPLSTVLKYDFEHNVWDEVSPMHQSRIDGAFVSVDGRIYATGGSTSKFRSRNTEVYNPVLDIWTTLNPMSVPRVNHGLVAVGPFLFAMGGQSYSGDNGGARNVQRTVEKYIIAEDRWENAWEMCECRWGMTSFVL